MLTALLHGVVFLHTFLPSKNRSLPKAPSFIFRVAMTEHFALGWNSLISISSLCLPATLGPFFASGGEAPPTSLPYLYVFMICNSMWLDDICLCLWKPPPRPPSQSLNFTGRGWPGPGMAGAATEEREGRPSLTPARPCFLFPPPSPSLIWEAGHFQGGGSGQNRLPPSPTLSLSSLSLLFFCFEKACG